MNLSETMTRTIAATIDPSPISPAGREAIARLADETTQRDLLEVLVALSSDFVEIVSSRCILPNDPLVAALLASLRKAIANTDAYLAEPK